MRKIYKVGIIGTGDISTQYLTNAKNVKMFKDYYQIVAVADPDPVRRNYIKDKFQLSDEACFEYGDIYQNFYILHYLKNEEYLIRSK